MKTSDIIHREKEAEKCMVCAVYWTTGYAKRGLHLHLTQGGVPKSCVAKVFVTNLAKLGSSWPNQVSFYLFFRTCIVFFPVLKCDPQLSLSLASVQYSFISERSPVFP